MSAPKRIQQRRTAGWRMPDGAKSVARPGKWGNPFQVVDATLWAHRGEEIPPKGTWLVIDRTNTRLCLATTKETATILAVAYHSAWAHSIACELDFTELAGLDLACWCPEGAPCHGEALLELANR